jgi:aspartate-semialdehyde dehydrogenase
MHIFLKKSSIKRISNSESRKKVCGNCIVLFVIPLLPPFHQALGIKQLQLSTYPRSKGGEADGSGRYGNCTEGVSPALPKESICKKNLKEVRFGSSPIFGKTT